MSLDCDYEDLNDRPKRCLVSYLLQVGESRQLLREIATNDDFQDLSRHNPYWHSNYPEEFDKLHELRGRLFWIYENLINILEKLE